MSKLTFDYSSSKEFEVKTKKGVMVLREPTPTEYFDYLNKVSKEGQDMKELYEHYVDYYVMLGGKEDLIRTLSFGNLMDLAKAINGGGEGKK